MKLHDKLKSALAYTVLSIPAIALVWVMSYYAGQVNRSMVATAATVGAGVAPALFGGRCTLTSNTPVLTSTVTSATTVYYTPAEHNRVTLYNGSDLVLYEFAELTNVTTDAATGNAGPAAAAASSVYDYFVWNNAGTLTLTRGPAWTDATTRSSGLTRQQGVWVNASGITNGPGSQRGTYVCTATTDAGATINWKYGTIAANGGQAILGIWNTYNRREITTGTIGDSSDSWTPTNTGTSWGPVHANSGVSAVFVRGLQEDSVSANYAASCAANNNIRVISGIGLDSTVSFVGTVGWYTDGTTLTNTVIPSRASYEGLVGIGQHQIWAIESTNGTSTCNGDAGAPTIVQTGLQVRGRM